MEQKTKIMLIGFLIAIVFVAIGVIWLGFANETLDVIANLFGAPEWELWIPPFPDYEIPGMEGVLLSNFLLGITFVGLILGITFGLMWLLVRLRQKE
ncbi:MAG: hypothetical protein ACFFBU_06565 [Promethearchaeota archaeon]